MINAIQMRLFSYSLQIQTKRELFFKSDGTGIISSPSVPSVPPPQPPTQAPGSQVNTSSSVANATTASSLTSPNTAPVYSSGALAGLNAKSRLPSVATTPISNDASEDSNRRESARTAITSKEDSNKEASLHHARPTPPTKPKELDGYVGFANLPNQVYRKAVKKGFEFTLMVVGQ